MGKSYAAGQPTRPTQPSIFSRSIDWVVSWYWMCAQVAPSRECLWGYGRVQLKRLLMFVLAAYARAKPCCCWLYLACMPVLVYLALSCVSAVVMHMAVVCLRRKKVDYYYYYYCCCCCCCWDNGSVRPTTQTDRQTETERKRERRKYP